jgi:hypothetical protein
MKTIRVKFLAATAAGTADGQEWAREQALVDLKRSLQLGADEELINALGAELAGKHLGGLSEGHLAAYNRAHALAVEAEIQHRAARFDDGSTLTKKHNRKDEL